MKKPPQKSVEISPPGAGAGRLQKIGGSINDDFNNIVINQTLAALWVKHSNAEALDSQYKAAITALIGIKPADELEGMLAAQLVATHTASLECHRRAMLSEQTFEGRESNLRHAVKLSRAYAELLQALDKHRGKGQQKVTVEHVHVHQGGQAIVSAVTTGGGAPSKLEGQPHAPGITYEPGDPLPSQVEADRETVPSSCG